MQCKYFLLVCYLTLASVSFPSMHIKNFCSCIIECIKLFFCGLGVVEVRQGHHHSTDQSQNWPKAKLLKLTHTFMFFLFPFQVPSVKILPGTLPSSPINYLHLPKQIIWSACLFYMYGWWHRLFFLLRNIFLNPVLWSYLLGKFLFDTKQFKYHLVCEMSVSSYLCIIVM